jgi:lipopolysaccharide biosynthesis protein
MLKKVLEEIRLSFPFISQSSIKALLTFVFIYLKGKFIVFKDGSLKKPSSCATPLKTQWIRQSRNRPNKGALIFHIFYLDDIEYIKSTIDIFTDIDVYVTSSNKRLFNDEYCNGIFSDCSIVIVENRGRDILPYLELISEKKFDEYKFVIKMHMKGGSLDRYKRRWTKMAIDELCEIYQNHSFTDNLKKNGILMPKSLVASFSKFSINLSRKRMGELCQKFLKIKLPSRFNYSMGSFLISSGAALQQQRKILELARMEKPEPLLKDGNIVHYCERLICLIQVK